MTSQRLHPNRVMRVGLRRSTGWNTVAIALLLSGWGVAKADTRTYTTGAFTPHEWVSSVHAHPSFPGGTGSATATTLATGGNPNAYRRVSLTVGPFQGVIGVQLWNVAVFTPATQGAISSVSLSYDVTRVFTSNPGATQVGKGIAVEQDGVIYEFSAGVSTASPPGWDHVVVANLVPLFPQVNWVNGNPIRFGFYDGAGTSGTGFTIDGGYDNYNVAVTFTPPPPPTQPVPVTIGASSSVSFHVTGTGCQPGTYSTPATLTWSPGSSCTVAVPTPQSGVPGTQYVFSGWSDGVTENPRIITTPASAVTYTAILDTQSQSCIQRPSGMISWWPGDGMINDFLGVNHPASFEAVTLLPGKVGAGFKFGPGGYIDIPPSASLANQRFTLQAWARPDGPSTNNDAIGNVIVQQNVDSDHAVGLAWRSFDGRFYFFFGDIFGDAIASNHSFPAGQFYHVAATYDGNLFSLYVNGVLEGQLSRSKTIVYSPSRMWIIGSAPIEYRGQGFSRTWNGVIDEVQAFNRALTATEIQSSVNAGSSGYCKANTVPATIDSTPSGLSVTVTGPACQPGSYLTPAALTWSQAALCMAAFSTPQSGPPGTQYAFSGWADGGAANPRTIAAPASAATYTGNFTTQYLLTAQVSPAGSGTILGGGSYYNAGTNASVTASANNGYGFENWTGPVASSTSPSTTIAMTRAELITANFVALTPVTIQTSPSGRSFMVDSQAYTASHVFFWKPGESHTISTSTLQPGGSGTQYVFSAWSDSGAMSHSITVPTGETTYTATFKTQYELITAAGTGGSIAPASGYFDAGTSVSVAATANSGYTFTNFSGNLTGSTNPQSITMAGSRSVTANFEVVPSNTAPSVAFTIAPATANEGETKTYNFSITDSDADQTFTFVGGFPDCGAGGTFVALSASINSVAKTGTFQCSFPGGNASPTVRVQVRDSFSTPANSNIASVNVTVANVAPTVTLTGPSSANEGEIKSYTFTLTDPGQDTFTVMGSPSCGIGGTLVAGSLTTNAGGGSFQCSFPDGPANSNVSIQVQDSDGAPSNTSAVAVTVDNVAPTVTLTGPSSANEGEIKSYTFTLTDPGQDTFTVMGSPSCGIGGTLVAGSLTTNAGGGSFQCNFPDGPASSNVSIRVQDSDGAPSNTSAVAVTVANVAPSGLAIAVSAAIIDENGSVSLSGSFTDAGTLDAHTLTINWGDGSPAQSVPLTTGARVFAGIAHQYLDDGPYAGNGTASDVHGISVTVSGDDGGVSPAAGVNVTVKNVAPVALTTTASSLVVPIGGTSTVTMTFTDVGTKDIHTCTFNWDGGGPAQTVTVVEPGGPGSCSSTQTFTATGVYSVKVTVNDDDTGSATEQVGVMIAVYDPNGGFVTGGGWIMSPAGAYIPNPLLTGKANFGFVSKYKPGATTPTGNTEFDFKTGNMNFHAESYQWLVVAGARAQYKGTGTINNTGSYGFLLTAIDSEINGGGNTDKFRIKIWDKNNGDAIVYDNAAGSDDINESQGTPLMAPTGNGSIVIHK